MTYAEEAVKLGKQPVQIIEIYLEKCSRSYGVAPCAAVLNLTGSDRCYNTRASCQDVSNFDPVQVVYRFASMRIEGLQAPGDPPIFPTLTNVETAPTVLEPGKGFGVRSSLSVTVQDHPWTDFGVDPYRRLRSYDPYDRGTFWGKFLSRNRFYENRRIDVLTGFLDDSGRYVAANFKRRSYIISKISGPGSDGVVKIEAKDPLRLADGEKAKWPLASTCKLVDAETSSSTGWAVRDTDDQLSFWWTSGQRYLKCEDEIVRATGASGLGTGTVTLTVVRASMPSWYDFSQNQAAAHDANATVQFCWLFEDAMVYDIVYFLLAEACGVDTAFLPLTDWAEEIDNGFEYMNYSTLLTEPVDVKKLLTELTELALLIWWHERDQKVYLKGLRFQQLIGPQINDDVAIVKESVAVTEDVRELTTQVWIFYDMSWPLANMEQLRSYRNVEVQADLDKESDVQYGSPAIREIRTRWLPRSKAGVANALGASLLKQYSQVRKAITISVDPKDDTFWVGDTVGISTRYVQDDSGQPSARNYLITQAEEQLGASLLLNFVALELYSYLRVGNITHPYDFADLPPDPEPAPAEYSDASTAEKNAWAYICYDGFSFLQLEDGSIMETEVGSVADDYLNVEGLSGLTVPRFLDGSQAYQII